MGGVQSKKEKKLNGYQHSDGIKQKLSNASNKSSSSDKNHPVFHWQNYINSS
jgi:hypothetical protein